MESSHIAIIPSQAHLQVPPNRVDDPVLNQAEDLLSSLSLFETMVVAEGQKTASKFKRFVAALQHQFTTLAKENQSLHDQLVTTKLRLQDVKQTSQVHGLAAQAKEEVVQREVFALRQKVMNTRQKAEADIAAEIDAKTKAVQAATAAGDKQVADAVRREENAKRETENLRLRLAQRREIAIAAENTTVEFEQHLEDINKMQFWIMQVESIFVKYPDLFIAPDYNDWVLRFKIFIIERTPRAITTFDTSTWASTEWILYINSLRAKGFATLRRVDIQKLQQLASELISLLTTCPPGDLRLAYLRSITQPVYEEMLALIAERNIR